MIDISCYNCEILGYFENQYYWLCCQQKQRLALDVMRSGRLPVMELWLMGRISAVMKGAICTSQAAEERYYGIWQATLHFRITLEILP